MRTFQTATTVLVAALLTVAASTGAADDPKGPPATKAAKKAKSGRQAVDSLVTPSREAAALAFVEEHHRELAVVLRQLQSMQPEQYDAAISELFATSERLAELQARGDGRYEMALEDWKLRSRIELLAARLTRQKSASMTDDLESLLHQQIDLRIRQQQWEKERLETRLRRIDSQIDRLEKERAKAVATQMRRMLPTKGSKPVPEKAATKSVQRR